MDNKQTVVDWLVEQYANENYGIEIYEQAKAMEKDQIMSAYMVCDDSGTLEESELYAEQYYNRTYGQ